MPMNKELEFVGTARPVKNGKMKLMFHREKLDKMKQYLDQPGNGDFIFLIMAEKRSQNGKWSHYLAIDTWKPGDNVKETRDEDRSNGFKDDVNVDFPF